jgi:ATP-dependent Zn protease
MFAWILRRRLIVVGILMGLAGLLGEVAVAAAEAERPYSEFLKAVDAGNVTEVVIDGEDVTWRDETGNRYETTKLDDPNLVRTLRDHGVVINVRPEHGENPILYALINWFPMLLLIGAWIYFIRRMRAGRRTGSGDLQDLAAKLDDVNAHLARIEGILAGTPPSAPAKGESGRSEA